MAGYKRLIEDAPIPLFKEIVIRKYLDTSLPIEVTIQGLWTQTEILAIPAAIRKERRFQINNLTRKEQSDE